MQEESMEPMLGWGFRMAISGFLPIVWGLATGHMDEAVWVALTAEAVTWMELKGSFTWRLWSLLAGGLLAVLSGGLGTLIGNSLILSCIGMLVVGFIATLLKSIGDRASGLAICFYLLFIVCNAYPTTDTSAFQERILLLAVGAAWPIALAMAATAIMPGQEPFRRQIAIIWRSIGALTESVSKSDSRPGYHGSLAAVYTKEREVRAAINSSFEFYRQAAHQTNATDNKTYQLAQLRKIAGLVAVNITAMGDEMNHISIHKLDPTLRIKAAALFGALQEACNRMSVYVVTMNSEEKLLVASQVRRMRKLTTIIRNYPTDIETRQAVAISRILQLTERTTRLLDNALLRVEQMGGDTRVFQSYSLVKTAFVLKPKYLLRNIQVLFNMNTLTFKYSLRSAIGATIALLIYKLFNIDHGFWMPFTLMIIIQPYFGATFKKARDRITGTLLGVIVGSALLYLPQGYYLHGAIMFATFVLMVYYVKKNYAISAFFITLNLILLFNFEASFSLELMQTRVLATIGGSVLAVASGWLLLPTWDKKMLPRFVAESVVANYSYFIQTFFVKRDSTQQWTRYKRNAESKNSNAFDSFNRYLQEPGKSKNELWYEIITCNVRISRNLNNIHMEQDEKNNLLTETLTENTNADKVWECQRLFHQVVAMAGQMDAKSVRGLELHLTDEPPILGLNAAQQLLLEKTIVELIAIKHDMLSINNKKSGTNGTTPIATI